MTWLMALHVPFDLDMANAEQWREIYLAALEKSNPVERQPLIDKARSAIFSRFLDLCDLSDSHAAEEEDLRGALRELWKAESINA